MRALITGISGQDGSYLAELLMAKGYEVHGLVRRGSRGSTSPNVQPLDKGLSRPPLMLHAGDLSKSVRLIDLLRAVKPHEIYNLAGQSSVGQSFEQPLYTGDISGLGTLRLLEAIRAVDPKIRLFQASTSELFGGTPPPQSEDSPFHPRSPYGVAKLYSYWIVKQYREAYGIFASNGILFSHESPRRGLHFVSRKISLAAARIARGHQEELNLGNLAARRDWGYAPEFVDAMWRILQHDEPDDFVLGTGETYSVEEFASFAFLELGLDYRDFVEVSATNLRPTGVEVQMADSRKAERILGWRASVRTPELARIMARADFDRLPA